MDGMLSFTPSPMRPRIGQVMKAPSRWTSYNADCCRPRRRGSCECCGLLRGLVAGVDAERGRRRLVTAATITVIDRAVRREAQQLLRPRTDVVLRNMAIDFHLLVAGIAFDYARAPGDRFVPLPQDALGIIDLWLSTRREAPAELRGSDLPDHTALSFVAREIDERPPTALPAPSVCVRSAHPTPPSP